MALAAETKEAEDARLAAEAKAAGEIGLAAEARAAERSVLQQKPRRLKRRALQPKPKQTRYYREHSLAAFGILQESSAQPVHEIGQLRKQARGALLQ